MITPEPTEVKHTEHITFPSDSGLQHRWYTAVVSIPEIGAAGHLGVTEEECTWIHASFALPGEQGPFACYNCGAAL